MPAPLEDPAKLRSEYRRARLDETDVAADPMAQFVRWFDEAVAARVPEPNAMTLATVCGGQPSARVVLLKGVEAGGFLFFTNYDSRKGRELDVDPLAALVFFWPELERQVRVEGRVERLDAGASDAYFASRPRASQLGAWASRQSAPVGSRAALEQAFAEAQDLHAGDVPRPPHWGGYRLVPAMLEFWQGRPSRLHDRIVYRLAGAAGAGDAKDAGWRVERLAP
jgi:pyridoxamine 5'-phosphate oxidase